MEMELKEAAIFSMTKIRNRSAKTTDLATKLPYPASCSNSRDCPMSNYQVYFKEMHKINGKNVTVLINLMAIYQHTRAFSFLKPIMAQWMVPVPPWICWPTAERTSTIHTRTTTTSRDHHLHKCWKCSAIRRQCCSNRMANRRPQPAGMNGRSKWLGPKFDQATTNSSSNKGRHHPNPTAVPEHPPRLQL